MFAWVVWEFAGVYVVGTGCTSPARRSVGCIGCVARQQGSRQQAQPGGLFLVDTATVD